MPGGARRRSRTSSAQTRSCAPGESGPLRAVYLSRHKWPGGLVNYDLTWPHSHTSGTHSGHTQTLHEHTLDTHKTHWFAPDHTHTLDGHTLDTLTHTSGTDTEHTLTHFRDIHWTHTQPNFMDKLWIHTPTSGKHSGHKQKRVRSSLGTHQHFMYTLWTHSHTSGYTKNDWFAPRHTRRESRRLLNHAT